MDFNEICKMALKKWGENAQINMVFEEIGELINVLVKIFRGRGDIMDLCDEIADVEIMLGQLKYTYNIFEIVNELKENKIDRLKRRLLFEKV